MNPPTSCEIYFHHPVEPRNKQNAYEGDDHIIQETELRVLDGHQHREHHESHIGHHTELVLVDRHTLLRPSVKGGVQFIAEQIQQIGDQQGAEEDADVGDERELRHCAGDILAAEHHQTGCDGEQIKDQQIDRHPVFQDFTFPLHQRKMALGEQRPANEGQFSAESDEYHREQQQQNTEHQRNPVVRLRHGIPLELRHTQPMPRKHGISSKKETNKRMGYLTNNFLVQSILPSDSIP